MKNKPMKISPEVPTDSSMRKALVSPSKKTAPSVEKKKALRPKAAMGNAVAVPRWCGQFSADVLMEAWKVMQLPRPVSDEKKQNKGTEPKPRSYASCNGKYPRARSRPPRMRAKRGPRLSTSRPMGKPRAYMPMLPHSPIRLLSVDDS